MTITLRNGSYVKRKKNPPKHPLYYKRTILHTCAHKYILLESLERKKIRFFFSSALRIPYSEVTYKIKSFHYYENNYGQHFFGADYFKCPKTTHQREREIKSFPKSLMQDQDFNGTFDFKLTVSFVISLLTYISRVDYWLNTKTSKLISPESSCFFKQSVVNTTYTYTI